MHNYKTICNFAAKIIIIMQTATIQNPRQALHNSGTKTVERSVLQPSRSIEEFMDDLAKRLGKHYGLNDIREAL